MKQLLESAPATEGEGEGQVDRLNTELKQQLAERTSELQALRAEGDAFAHSIAHDLRGPLMHISGFAELLAGHSAAQLDDKGRQYLQTIIASSDLLAQMIADLRAFEKLNRARMQPILIDPGVLVREVARELAPAARHQQVIWQIEDLPAVHADPVLLRLAITSLVANALKFTQPRVLARIQVGSRCVGAETIFFVRDNGVGFDMAHAGKLFGLFQRLHDVTAFPGHGVGLAGVRRIIQRHGGRTWAEAVPEEGATFYFSLPETAPDPT